MANAPMYEPTWPGELEVKRLPALDAYEAASQRDFFAARNPLFARDFAFLRANGLSMTTPVEADVHPGAMRFFVPPGARPDTPVEGVRLVAVPERTVVAIGLRGNYSRAAFEEGAARLREWLAQNPEWRAEGEPYAVYWDAPMKPWFLKRSEVHLPVSPAPSTSA